MGPLDRRRGVRPHGGRARRGPPAGRNGPRRWPGPRPTLAGRVLRRARPSWRCRRRPRSCRRRRSRAILYVMPYDELDEAIAIQNGVPQGLSSSIFTTDVREAEASSSAAGSDCGIANVNVGAERGRDRGRRSAARRPPAAAARPARTRGRRTCAAPPVTVNYSRELPLAQGVRFDVERAQRTAGAARSGQWGAERTARAARSGQWGASARPSGQERTVGSAANGPSGQEPEAERVALDRHLHAWAGDQGGASGPRTTPFGPAPASPGTELMALFEAQVTSRHLDLAARWLRGGDQGYYTIGSSRATRATPPWPPRSARRTRRSSTTGRAGSTCAGPCRCPGTIPGGTCCSGWWRRPTSRWPAGATRSFGHHTWRSSRRPRRSRRTCPRALGRGVRIDRATRLGVPSAWPADAIAVCSFGDASANHSTATGAINTACRIAHQHLPAAAAVRVRGQRARHQRAHARRAGSSGAYGQPPGSALLRRPTACDPVATFDDGRRGGRAGSRRARRPAFLHLRTVRFMGHAGTRRRERRTARPAEIRADDDARPARSAPRGCSSRRASRRRRRSSTATSAIRARGAAAGRGVRRRARS